MKKNIGLLFLGIVFALVSCNSPAPNNTEKTVSDASEKNKEIEPTEKKEILVEKSAKEENIAEKVTEKMAETIVEKTAEKVSETMAEQISVEKQTKKFGVECDKNEDCEDNLCVLSGSKKICSKNCTSGNCPTDYVCLKAKNPTTSCIEKITLQSSETCSTSDLKELGTCQSSCKKDVNPSQCEATCTQQKVSSGCDHCSKAIDQCEELEKCSIYSSNTCCTSVYPQCFGKGICHISEFFNNSICQRTCTDQKCKDACIQKHYSTQCSDCFEKLSKCSKSCTGANCCVAEKEACFGSWAGVL